MLGLPIVNFLYQKGTLVTTGEPSPAHHYHKSIIYVGIYVVCVSIHLKEYRCVSQNVWRRSEDNLKCCPHFPSGLREVSFYLPVEYTELVDPILPTEALGLQMLLAQVYVGSRDSDAGSQTCTVSAFTHGAIFLFLVFFIYRFGPMYNEVHPPIQYL